MKRATGSTVDGFDKLIAAGIVAISEAPKPRKRGGQQKARTDDEALVWWTDWFQKQFRVAGKPTTKRQAIAHAMHFRSALRELGASALADLVSSMGPSAKLTPPEEIPKKRRRKQRVTWAVATARGDSEHYLEPHYYAARRRLQKKKQQPG